MFITKVYGASKDLNLTGSITENLITQNGMNSPNLNKSPNLVPKNIFTIKYDLNHPNIENTGLVLNYALDSNTIVKYKLVFDDVNYYKAYVDIYKSKLKGGSGTEYEWTKEPFNPLVFNTILGDRYVTADEFIATTTPNSSHQIIKDGSENYYFKAEKGEGFSFKIGDMEVSFRHDNVENKMTYTTNRI